MSAPILMTKFYIPPIWQAELVSRPQLIDRLNQGLRQNPGFALNQAFGRKLTVISAPAGFGKTTLVSNWIHSLVSDTANQADAVNRVAWLSLEEADNGLIRFFTYFITALQIVQPAVGAATLAVLQSPQPLPIESMITGLINDIASQVESIVFVLDDYHHIDNSPIHEAVIFLLNHLPGNLHLVITTRVDPPFPLARLRLRGELVELREADLRFTMDEATTFFNRWSGLKLTSQHITALENRTEGWIAGLRAAALSLEGYDAAQTSDFIQNFTGSDRFIFDFLVEEILSRQPENIQTFLLETSILNQLYGPLCDAVTTHASASQPILDYLEQTNLFIIPLDNERRRYRYHHLFADVLRALLIETQPDEVSTLHQRASAWYDQNGMAADAIRHALVAVDFERAASLIELAWPAMRSTSQEATALVWMKQLPNALVRLRPVLSVAYALALLNGGALDAAEARLQDAEQWLDQTEDTALETGISETSSVVQPVDLPDPSRKNSPSTPAGQNGSMIVADEAQFQSLPASIANARAYHAQAIGDVSGTVMYARQALKLLPEGEHYERGTTAALLGLAYWESGDLEAAHQSFADGLATFQMTGDFAIVIGGTLILANIRMAQGRLNEAARSYERALQLATAQGEPVILGTAELYMGLCDLYREQGDLEAAKQHLLSGEALSEQASNSGFAYLWFITRARLKEALGDLDGALDQLQEAERLYNNTPVPDVRPIAALKTRVWVKQGRLAEALDWVREQRLSADDNLSYLHEFEHLTLVRVLIALYKRDQIEQGIQDTMKLLARLLKAAEAGERIGSVIEILILQALAYEAQGDTRSALGPLERALTLAEPESYVRIFVDEGSPMARLFHAAASHKITPDYTQRLLATFASTESEHVESAVPQAPATNLQSSIIEPLSERELDVLRLLKTELSGPEIARELMIALSTVRTHTKSIYEKLSVNNRRSAVNRATELDLI